MDVIKNIIAALAQYGKGPFVRYVTIALVGWLASKGITEAQAGQFAEAAWPIVIAALTFIVNLAFAALSRKKLHEAAPPVKPADASLADDLKTDVIGTIGQDKPKP